MTARSTSPVFWLLREPSAEMLHHTDGFPPAGKKDLFYSSISAPQSVRLKPAETNPPAWLQDAGFLLGMQSEQLKCLCIQLKHPLQPVLTQFLTRKRLLKPLEFFRFLAFYDVQIVHQVAYFL